MITPFTVMNQIDYESCDKIIEKLLSDGVDGLIICGTTGEAPTLSESEKIDLLEHVIKKVEKRCEIWFGCGSNSTCSSMRLLKLSENLDFKGYLIVTPYYNMPTQYGLYEHYATLAYETDKEIMLYNVPKRCGVSLSKETIVKLANDFKNITAFKQADRNLETVKYVLAHSDLNVYSGEDGYLLEGMMSGMSGVVSVIGHLYAKELREFLTLFEQGEDCIALDTLFKVISQLIFLESNPICIKYLFEKKGYCKNILRLPMTQATFETANQLDLYF